MNWVAFGTWVIVLHCAALALWLGSLALNRLGRAAPSTVAAVAFFVSIATVVAQKNSPTNEPPRMAPLNGGTGRVEFRKDIAPIGGVAVQLRTTGASAFAAALNKVDKINARGAWVDSFRLDFPDGFIFPFGTNHLSFVEVFSQGYVRPRRMTYEMLADIGERVAIVPGLSQLSVEYTPSNSVRIAWEEAAVNRSTNSLISAAIELFSNGNFLVETNGVATTTERVHPSDLDGDGLPDGLDPNPTVWDGDFFGPRNILPEGANSNAYCYVDLVVHGADAEVVFSGDGPSNLADPHFMARAEETNRVAILIGKGYEISADEPVECIGVSDASIDVCQTSENTLYVRWPVAVECAAMRSGASFSMYVYPDWLGGEFVWTNRCCSISSSGHVFSYSCNDACHCTGCAATGYYGYEGFMLPVCGGHCGCSSDGEFDERPSEEDDDGPYAAGATATFSKSAVIFEDGYWNSPTNWVERQSTQTELHCVAHGGPNGGHVRFEILGEDKLERVSGHVLPVEQDVSPGKKLDFTIVYKGQLPSSAAEDIIVTTTFTENVPNATQEQDEEKLTSVKFLTVSTNFSLDPYPYRHNRGIGETFCCEFEPSVAGTSILAQNGAVCTAIYSDQSDISCPYYPASKIVKMQVSDATYEPNIFVLMPTGVEARNPHELSYSVPVNSPGGAGFQMDLHILPDTVSFQALEFWERALETFESSTIEGYFTNWAFRCVWYHNTNMSAGVWHRIGDDNFWFTDNAQMGDELITPVCSGRLVWHIPIDWRSNSNPTIQYTDFKCVDQQFEMTDTGRLTVSKYGYWAAREMSGATYKSEDME